MCIQAGFSLILLLLPTHPGLAVTIWASTGTEPRCEGLPSHSACPRILQPLCGTNGVTFTNLCNLCLYNWGTGFKVRILHNGECELVKGPAELKAKRMRVLE
ncbi:serine protease inhibitor Kazal-type 1-like isoform X3 [Narcine bancroftii]|uniref:serine protease inhibitor Kazal-type 1-like isoform X3 n=1 Tax=Narcine bancroftii TaxID=1343680 RepID=UPI0038319DAA